MASSRNSRTLLDLQLREILKRFGAGFFLSLFLLLFLLPFLLLFLYMAAVTLHPRGYFPAFAHLLPPHGIVQPLFRQQFLVTALLGNAAALEHVYAVRMQDGR
jgi:hypothetical protein